MISVSAPGKVILVGEHAVVFGRPALAVPVRQVRATATVTAPPVPLPKTGRAKPLSVNWQTRIKIEAPDIGLTSDLGSLLSRHSPDPLAAAITGVFSTLGIASPPPMNIHVSSTIPVASGLGSGAAVSVAIIHAVAEYLGQPLPDDQVSDLAYEVEKIHHGTPSGIDNTVIAFGTPVFFIKNSPAERFHVGTPFTLVIGDTGISAPTKESVGDVRRLWQSEPERWEKVFDRIKEIVHQARQAIETGDPADLGPLMDENHALLQLLTVSSPELDRLVLAARHADALGAKLSGGGRGGNMIALVHKENAPAVAEALVSAGARRTIITEIS
jgi:mevalonate kinase